MTRVILQPAGDGVGKKNYTNTISNKVSISRIEKYLTTTEVEHIRNMCPDGMVPVWGVTPGDKNRNKKQWELINKGDIALFSGNNNIFTSATVTYKINNKYLAEELWGWKEQDVTWEFIYFLDEVKRHKIHITEFNQLLGYSLNNPIRGFRVLDEEKSTKIVEYFKFNSNKYFEKVSVNQYKALINQFIQYDSLETTRIVKVRKEQLFLRQVLFGDKTTEFCGICQMEFPIELLITAHIKKRAECTIEEKLDYKNVVMPMCTFGCDHLFEKGYIGIRNGFVELLKKEEDLTLVLKEYIGKLRGNYCNHWTESSKRYFDWHRDHHNNK